VKEIYLTLTTNDFIVDTLRAYVIQQTISD